MKINHKPIETASEFAESMARAASLAADPNLHDGLTACEPVVTKGIEDNFNNAQSSDGTKWPPHSPLTVATYGPHPLLILTGAMKQAALGGTGGVRRIGGDYLEVAISKDVIPYAGVHQDGYDLGNIPQREYLGFSDAVLDECEELLAADFIQEVLS